MKISKIIFRQLEKMRRAQRRVEALKRDIDEAAEVVERLAVAVEKMEVPQAAAREER